MPSIDENDRVTDKPEVESRPNSQLRGREVSFEEIAIDLLEARFWKVSVRPTTRPEPAKAGTDYFPGES